MKELILAVCLLLSFRATSQAFAPNGDDKGAILMVHFGTTYDDTRSATIDALNAKVREAFPEMRVEEAYTSRIVIKRLKERGIVKHTPQEMLLRLAADGYTHVFIQGTNVIDGVETDALRNEAEMMAPFFEDIRVGYPLLYSLDDCSMVTRILSDRYAAEGSKGGAVVFVGHGTETPANAMYSQVDYMFTATGHPRCMVATIEGYPTYSTTLPRLKEQNVKHVTLVPLMFVAGDHARNDIGTDWREALEKDKFKVDARLEGLGQVPAIQELYIDHIRQGMKERPTRQRERKYQFIKKNL